jgi:hypothetical protein
MRAGWNPPLQQKKITASLKGIDASIQIVYVPAVPQLKEFNYEL